MLLELAQENQAKIKANAIWFAKTGYFFSEFEVSSSWKKSKETSQKKISGFREHRAFL